MPIEVDEIGGVAGQPDAIYFRFARGTPKRSLQPDPERFVFLEVEGNGKIIGVLSYEALCILLTESAECVPVLDDGGVGGDELRYSHEVQFQHLAKYQARLEAAPC